MPLFDSSHTSSIVTMAASFTVFEIKRDIQLVENASFSYPLPFNLHDHLEPL